MNNTVIINQLEKALKAKTKEEMVVRMEILLDSIKEMTRPVQLPPQPIPQQMPQQLPPPNPVSLTGGAKVKGVGPIVGVQDL